MGYISGTVTVIQIGEGYQTQRLVTEDRKSSEEMMRTEVFNKQEGQKMSE